ncbi:DUF7210 family protein [Rhodanobacter sp. BL-MT-08]
MKRVTLLYPHTHASVPHATGVSLSVPDHVATWLINRGIVEVARVERSVTVPAPSAAPAAPVEATEQPAADPAPTTTATPAETTGAQP